MIDPLPFAALRTFEAVVRLKGFVRAAEELGVTQSAVSQQVKTLEEWLGHRLIDRVPGGISPSRDGLLLADAIAEGFGSVASVCKTIKASREDNLTIGLSCNPGFAFLWVIPRLIDFDQRYPQYQVSIVTAQTPEDFLGADVDVAIRYGSGPIPGMVCEPLLSEHLFPVCAPPLMRESPITDPADLAHHTRLSDQLSDERGATAPDWAYWAREVGADLPDPLRERRFGQSNMVIQAAIEGLGVALGREPLVYDALASGDLVRPFPELVPSQYSYWLLHRRGDEKSERVRAIRDWLLEEAAQQPAVPEGSLWSDMAG